MCWEQSWEAWVPQGCARPDFRLPRTSNQRGLGWCLCQAWGLQPGTAQTAVPRDRRERGGLGSPAWRDSKACSKGRQGQGRVYPEGVRFPSSCCTPLGRHSVLCLLVLLCACFPGSVQGQALLALLGEAPTEGIWPFVWRGPSLGGSEHSRAQAPRCWGGHPATGCQSPSLCPRNAQKKPAAGSHLCAFFLCPC